MNSSIILLHMLDQNTSLIDRFCASTQHNQVLRHCILRSYVCIEGLYLLREALCLQILCKCKKSFASFFFFYQDLGYQKQLLPASDEG